MLTLIVKKPPWCLGSLNMAISISWKTIRSSSKRSTHPRGIPKEKFWRSHGGTSSPHHIHGHSSAVADLFLSWESHHHTNINQTLSLQVELSSNSSVNSNSGGGEKPTLPVITQGSEKSPLIKNCCPPPAQFWKRR